MSANLNLTMQKTISISKMIFFLKSVWQENKNKKLQWFPIYNICAEHAVKSKNQRFLVKYGLHRNL